MKAWELTEEEFNRIARETIPIGSKDKRGTYTSLNGKYTIVFKSNRWIPAGMAKAYICTTNGLRMPATYNHIQKLLLEIDEYSGWITYDSVKEWAANGCKSFFNPEPR